MNDELFIKFISEADGNQLPATVVNMIGQKVLHVAEEKVQDVKGAQHVVDPRSLLRSQNDSVRSILWILRSQSDSVHSILWMLTLESDSMHSAFVGSGSGNTGVRNTFVHLISSCEVLPPVCRA